MLNRGAICLCLCILTACVKDNCSNPDGYARLSIDVAIDNEERIAKQVFESGDQIGIYMVSYVNETPGILGDVINTTSFNVPYTYSGISWNAYDGQEIFLDETLSDLYAYYPYDDEMSAVSAKLDLSAYPFEVRADQSQLLMHNDFLWAKVTELSVSNSQADIAFSHLMSRCEINLKFDEGEIPLDPQLKIYNTQTFATINLRSGVASAAGGNRVVLPYLHPTPHLGYDFTYDAIIIPQFIEDGTPLFTVTTNNGETLVYEAIDDFTFQPQKIRVFNLTVGENSLR